MSEIWPEVKKVSVITACYNCELYIRQAVESVASQDYSNFEHIVLDDDSDDKSYRILKQLEERCPRLKVFRSADHLKCGSAYSVAASHATGDVIAVLDADDVLVKGAIRKLVEMYNNNLDVGYIWTQHWYCNQQLEKIKKGISCHPGELGMLGNGGHCFSHWRTFRRPLLEKGEIFKSGLKAAVDKWMGYALEELAAGGFANVPLYKYRQRPGGLSYTGRRAWKKMKSKFTAKRESHDITPYPIKAIKVD